MKQQKKILDKIAGETLKVGDKIKLENDIVFEYYFHQLSNIKIPLLDICAVVTKKMCLEVYRISNVSITFKVAGNRCRKIEAIHGSLIFCNRSKFNNVKYIKL